MSGQKKSATSVPDINESNAALNFEDTFRRIGFTFLIVIVFAAMAGCFSSGYFSSGHKENANGSIKIDYQRFARLLKDYDITIKTKGTTPVTLQLGEDFTDAYLIEDITPQPNEMYSRGNKLYLRYNGTGEDLTLWLTLKPTSPGRFTSSLSVNNQGELTFTQLIYP